MNLAEFVRLYPLRAKKLALLCGAGTSVSAGMPSAWDLVWQFKRAIYCAEERYDLSLFKNLSDPVIRRQIQTFFDSKGNYPPEDSVEEYSFYFEKAYSSPLDRRIFLAEQLSGMQNSYGHKVLGVLMKNELVNLIFTTNFDKAFEDAAANQLKKSDKYFVASTDNGDTSVKIYHEGKRPFICKLHGDYFSEKLKNTKPELQTQDTQLRTILYHACLSNGLAVMGYSGRDKSVMEILLDALDQPNSFPMGIFWFIKADTAPLPPVSSFLDKARSKGIETNLVEIETFDTAMADIAKGISFPTEDADQLNRSYYTKSSGIIQSKGNGYPIIRFNAVKVLELPATARILQCNIGNTREVKSLVDANHNTVIATRKREGVVGFGPDAEFDRIFGSFSITEKGVYQIPEKVILHDDSTLKGMLLNALMMALSRGKPLLWTKRGNRYLLFPSYKNGDLNNPLFDHLKKELGTPLFGQIASSSVRWLAAIEVELHKKLDNFFMVINPTAVTTKPTIVSERAQIAPFVKEFTARWYNVKYNQILEAWLDIIFQSDNEISLTAFDSHMQGFNAQFKLRRNSHFTKKY